MTRGSNEIKLSVWDRFYEPTTMIEVRTCLHNEDSVTFKSLSLVPDNKPLDQSHLVKLISATTELLRGKATTHYLMRRPPP